MKKYLWLVKKFPKWVISLVICLIGIGGFLLWRVTQKPHHASTVAGSSVGKSPDEARTVVPFDIADVVLCGNTLVNFHTGEILARQWLDGFGDQLPPIAKVFAEDRIVVVCNSGIAQPFGFDGKARPTLRWEGKEIGPAAFSWEDGYVVFVHDGNLCKGIADWQNSVLKDAKRVTDAGFFRPDTFRSDWFWSGNSIFVSELGKTLSVDLNTGKTETEKVHPAALANGASPDHKITVVGTGFNSFAVVDLEKGRVQQLPIKASLKQVHWLGNDKAVILANSSQFQIFDRTSMKVISTFESRVQISSIASNAPGGKTLLIETREGVQFLDLETKEFTAIKVPMECGAWISGGKFLYGNSSMDSKFRGVWWIDLTRRSEQISNLPPDSGEMGAGRSNPMTEVPGGCFYISQGQAWRYDSSNRSLRQLTTIEHLSGNLSRLDGATLTNR